MIGDFPPHVQATVRRILDAEAQRLLTEELDRDAPGTTAGADIDALDRPTDRQPGTGPPSSSAMRRQNFG